jgi:hypothetical protein
MTKCPLRMEVKLPAVFTILLFLLGCETTYYKTMEKFGYHKRDLMVERVEEARDAQKEAKEQFESALEKFSSVLKFEGGELEEKYETLKAEYEKGESKAEAVGDRIEAVEDVAEDLFEEWQNELSQYTNQSLRRSSERKLRQTRQQYSQLIRAMKRVEKKIDPVLSAFRDQVLYLKHNLNARAIASLRTELVSVEADVASLIREMEASIAEANTFIKAIEKE